ncbi:MAG: hypothetical protein RI935_649 [Candidatus Parcubacteria bacterium]
MTGSQIFSNIVQEIFTPLYGLAVGCSLVYFLFGVVKFIWQSKNPDNSNQDSLNDGKRHMLWGLIGLFMVLSVGGIMALFSEFGGDVWK